MPVEFYESLQAFARSLPKKAPEPHLNETSDDWSGCQSYAQARGRLFDGDSSAWAESEKLLEQVEGSGLQLAVPYWDNDRVGSTPCVPSHLAGSPDSMRRLQEVPSDNAPIKIVYDVCLSAGFTGAKLASRGTAVLALVRKLQAIRPVELRVIASLDSHRSSVDAAVPVITIDTNPLDLASVSYVMGNPGMLRRLCFAWGYDGRGFTGGWAYNQQPSQSVGRLSELLELDLEHDLFINGAYATDELMQDPVAWVNAQVRKYAAVLEEHA